MKEIRGRVELGLMMQRGGNSNWKLEKAHYAADQQHRLRHERMNVNVEYEYEYEYLKQSQSVIITLLTESYLQAQCRKRRRD